MKYDEHFGFDTGADGKRISLGNGGFGSTYRGWVEFERKDQEFYLGAESAERIPAALKMINRAQTSAFSLKREVILLSRVKKLKHPCLVNYLSFFYYEYTPVIATTLVEGGTLTKEITRSWLDGQPMPEGWIAQVLDWGRQLASAIECLHTLGIIHRDIKPSNIMIRELDRRPVLIDFGLGRSPKIQRENGLDQESVFTGAMTPEFASPEQFCTGRDTCEACRQTPCELTSKADVYALGATLWYALTRTALHEDSTRGLERGKQDYLQALGRAKREGFIDVERLPANKPLRHLFQRMLTGNSTARPDAREVHDAFKSILGEDTGSMPSTFDLDPIAPESLLDRQNALPRFLALGRGVEIAAILLPADAVHYWSPHEVDRIDFDDFATTPARLTHDDALELLDAINSDPELLNDAWHYRLPTVREWRRAAGFRPDSTDGNSPQYRRLFSDLGEQYEWCDEPRQPGVAPECRPVCFFESSAPRNLQRHRRWPKGVIRLVREPRAAPVPGTPTT